MNILATLPKQQPIKWVYDHLICEFNHWDICLTGLVEVDGIKMLATVEPEYDGNCHQEEIDYTLQEIAWDAECDEYLEDYRVAYKHWFHPRKVNYDGRSLEWFSDKWQRRNPIEEKAKS